MHWSSTVSIAPPSSGVEDTFCHFLFKKKKNVDIIRASRVALVVKNPTASAGGFRDTGSIPGVRRSPGGGNGNPLQYSCLENLMDRGA